MEAKLRAMVQATPGQKGGRAGSSRKTTPKSLSKFEAILEATIDCLVEDGYHGTSLSRIAERVGGTRGGLQYYFNSTEDALRAAVEYLLWRRQDAYDLRVLTASPPPGTTRFEIAMDAILAVARDRYYTAWVELLSASRTEPSLRPLVDLGIETRQAGMRETWRAFLESGPIDFELYDAVSDIWAAVDTTIALGRYNDAKRLDIMIHTLKKATLHLMGVNDVKSSN